MPDGEPGDEEDGPEDAVDEEQLLLDHKNLYWTRLMVIKDYEAHHERKWPLGPDLVEECLSVTELELDGESHWETLFDPLKFNEDHGPLLLEQYRLNNEELATWAKKSVKLRKSIEEKAKEVTEPEPDVEVDNEQGR